MPRQKTTNTGSVFTLLLSNFLNVFGWALITPLYALYVVALGGTPQTATFSWAVYSLLAGVLMIVIGWLEDRIERKAQLLTVGYTIQSLGVAVLFFASSVSQLMLGLGVYAVGMGIVMPMWKQLFAHKAHKGHETAEWGVFHGVNTLLVSAAAAISGILFAAWGFKGIFGLMVGAHVFAAAVSLRRTR